jgi:TolA-binding protein
MHIRALPATYTPPPTLPSENVTPRSTAFQQLQRQIEALQQEGEQTSASTGSQAAVTVQQDQSDIARLEKQANGSSAAATSSGSDDEPRGSSAGAIGQMIDVIA